MRTDLCRTAIALSLAWMAALAAAAPARGQSYKDMTYFTVPGCKAVDTRIAGGAIGTNKSRTFQVTGSGSFATQGGSSTGCGVPAISNDVAQVQAVNLNVVAINTTATGFLQVYAADQTSEISLLNFPAAATVSTNVVVPVNQSSAVKGDITVTYGDGAGGHVLVSVVGYFATPQQTVAVHPVPGNPTASGSALLDAFAKLDALTGSIAPSSTRQYMVKLDPGLYNLGTSPLNLLSYVDLVGSGQDATIIQGTGYGEGVESGTLVASSITSAEVRDLQVQVSTSASLDALGFYLYCSPITLRHVTVTCTAVIPASPPVGYDAVAYGIHTESSNSTIEDVTITASGGDVSYGIGVDGLSEKFGEEECISSPVIRRAVVSVTGTLSESVGLFFGEEGSPTFRNVEVAVSSPAGGMAEAVQDLGTWDDMPVTATFADSSLLASGQGKNYGIHVEDGTTYPTYKLDNVKVVASSSGSGKSWGISMEPGFGPFIINRSEITGTTLSASGSNGSFVAGASHLAGGVTGFFPQTCAACYDANYAALSSTCN